MKLLAFSDIHLDAVTAGRPRLDEVALFLNHALRIATTEQVDLVVFGGDAHDPGTLLDPMYSTWLIAGLMEFPMPVVAIAGNHDVLDTSELYDGQPITTLTPLRAASQYCPRDLYVLDKPQVVQAVPGWAVLGLPYVSRAHAHRNAGWLDSAFADVDVRAAHGHRVIVVGHLVVPGARMGSESVEMAKGQEQLFPFERVAALNPALVLNGHYHGRQVVNANGMPVVIPGSPLRFTFGEADEVEKGVLLAEL